MRWPARRSARSGSEADVPLRSYLSKDMQDKQTPFAFYLQKDLAQVQAERAERASLGTGQPYNRQLP